MVINYGEGGYKIGKIVGPKLFAPPTPSRQGKLYARTPPFKEWELFAPPFNMAKTSSYHVNTTPKVLSSPLQHGQNPSPPLS